MKKVGFIGLGVMGTAMAQNLLKAGFEVFVWARHPEKAQATLDKGAHWCDTLADCARGRDAVDVYWRMRICTGGFNCLMKAAP